MSNVIAVDPRLRPYKLLVGVYKVLKVAAAFTAYLEKEVGTCTTVT